MLNAQHLKMVQVLVQSLTLTEACIQLKLLPSLVYSYHTHSSVLICFEKAKLMEPYEET